VSSPPLPVVSVQALSHAYGNRVALNDLTLQIAPSQIFALLGPNGSGKSTLFKILSTLMPLQQGSVEICGISLASNQSKIRAQLGVVFQSPSVDRMLTVKENLAQQAALFGVRGKQFQERFKLLTTQFGLIDRIHDRAGTLSGGLRRRVELAAAMLHQPQVLLLDEPSTGLDPAARLEL
jgi:ABC-2 type transport system ATP-binding protein